MNFQMTKLQLYSRAQQFLLSFAQKQNSTMSSSHQSLWSACSRCKVECECISSSSGSSTGTNRRMLLRVWAQHLCSLSCQAAAQAWVRVQLWLWRYSLMHCRPCFFCRVLLHSEQVAQLEKEPGTRWCLFSAFSLASFPFSLCCSLSRFLPCRETSTGREFFFFSAKSV